MPKLNQIIAIEKGSKNQTHASITSLYQKLEKGELFDGIHRTYRPKDDDGDTRPEERKNVQMTSAGVVKEAKEHLVSLFDVTATKDWGNTEAKADIVVDDVTLVEGCPVSFMLFLEKQMKDIRAVISKIPVLDPAQNWTWDDKVEAYVAEEYQTTSTKKVPQNHILAEATEHHPAQVQMYHTDEIVGYWTTKISSGAMLQADRSEMLERLDKIQAAVKFSREEANGLKVENQEVGENILGYIFG